MNPNWHFLSPRLSRTKMSKTSLSPALAAAVAKLAPVVEAAKKRKADEEEATTAKLDGELIDCFTNAVRKLDAVGGRVAVDEELSLTADQHRTLRAMFDAVGISASNACRCSPLEKWSRCECNSQFVGYVHL